MSRTIMAVALAGVLASSFAATNAQALGVGGIGPGAAAIHPAAPIGGIAPMPAAPRMTLPPAAPRMTLPTVRVNPPIGGAVGIPCSAMVVGLRTNCF